jgi:hypothetical protein
MRSTEARLRAGRKIEQWITRRKSAEMRRAGAAALSIEHASPLRAAGRRSIVRSSTCRSWAPASRWKAPSEFRIHLILCLTTHPSAVVASLGGKLRRLVLRSPRQFSRVSHWPPPAHSGRSGKAVDLGDEFVHDVFRPVLILRGKIALRAEVIPRRSFRRNQQRCVWPWRAARLQRCAGIRRQSIPRRSAAN